MARKIESLRQDQLIDWKQAFREVRHIYKDFQNVKIQEQEEAGNLSKPLGYSHIIYIYIYTVYITIQGRDTLQDICFCKQGTKFFNF